MPQPIEAQLLLIGDPATRLFPGLTFAFIQYGSLLKAGANHHIRHRGVSKMLTPLASWKLTPPPHKDFLAAE